MNRRRRSISTDPRPTNRRRILTRRTAKNLQSSSPPDHLIYEIRVRLPPKSLVRFRSVSKAWKNISTDPYLIRKQLCLHPTHNPSLLCFMRRRPGRSPLDGMDTWPLSIKNERKDVSIKGELSFYGIELSVPYNCDLHSACNGWFCFRIPPDNGPILYNPLRKQTLELQALPHAADCRISYYGLGFDGKSHLFKLFCIATFDGGRLGFFKLTHNNNAWTPVEFPTPVYGWCASRSSVFVKGAVHYHLKWGNPAGRPKIAAFDVHEEKLKLIAFPRPAIPGTRCRILAKVGGFLAVFEYPHQTPADLCYVHMRKNGKWNLQHSITRHQMLCRFGVTSDSRFYPPVTTCDDRIIITWNGEVIAYDIRTGKMGILLQSRRRFSSHTDDVLFHSLELSVIPLNGLVES